MSSLHSDHAPKCTCGHGWGYHDGKHGELAFGHTKQDDDTRCHCAGCDCKKYTPDKSQSTDGIRADTKFTPGPWECLSSEFREDGIVAFEIRLPKQVLCKADGDLIAAAPDMYETLQTALAFTEDELECRERSYLSDNGKDFADYVKPARDLVNKIKAAIAKAEGKEAQL